MSLILAPNCTKCNLAKNRQQIVWGDGRMSAPIMFICEAPGEWEDKHGKPMWYAAQAGKEFNHLLMQNDYNRDMTYVTNLCKCRPLNNRDPKSDEIEACSPYVYEEIKRVQPHVIVTVGRYSTRFLLGDVDMEAVHGIPFKRTIQGEEYIIVPSYHVAAGLRSPEAMLRVQMDFSNAFEILRGNIKKFRVDDEFEGREQYNLCEDPDKMRNMLADAQIVAIDTETINRNRDVWGLSISAAPGYSLVVLAHTEDVLQVINEHVQNPDVTTLIHNSLFDLDILARIKVFPATVLDTMVMAYLLQFEPQGLKPLAFRHCGMKMEDYSEVVSVGTAAKADKYLRQIIEYNWPDPEPILTFKKDGEPHIKKPQNIVKKVKRILTDVEKKGAIAWDRWHRIKPEDGRSMIEECLGRMPEGDLSDVPFEKAVWYSARDADATIRIFPYLLDRIQAYGLAGALKTDMGTIPMVFDMSVNGVQPNVEHFNKLSYEFYKKMLNIEAEVNKMAMQPVNLGSPKQVAELLYDRFHIRGVKKRSTEDKVLARLIASHPVVPLIRQWRGYAKLKNTYADKIPTFLNPKTGRIHPTVRITRTSTGRLSTAGPNIQAQPVRSAEAKEIRNGYLAREGCSFVSVDFSQVELRVLAHETQDPTLLRVYREDIDLHTLTGSEIFEVPIDQVDDKEHRYPSKRINFGIVYDITAPGLWEILLKDGLDPKKWTVKRCQEVIDKWFKIYPGVLDYRQRIATEIRRYGFVRGMEGRIRFIPSAKAADDYRRAKALREGGNFPIQWGAQCILKKAMEALTPLYKAFVAEGYHCDPIIQIHDELMFEVSDEILDVWVPMQMHVMQNIVQLSVPLKVDAEVGKVWGTMKAWEG